MSAPIETILTNIKTALLTIKTADGYNNTVAAVDNSLVADDTIAAYPVCWVIASENEDFDKPGHMADTNELITIYGLIKSTTDPQRESAKLRTDIKKCLANDETLNGACDRIVFQRAAMADDVFNLDGQPPGFNYPLAAIRIEYLAQYTFDQESGEKA